MGKVEKTMDRAQDTARKAQSTLETTTADSREAAAGIVERAGGGIRSQSKRAARATEQAGDRIGTQLERTAAKIRPQRSPARRVGGYLWRHPVQALLLFGLITGVVALVALPLIGRRSQENAEFDDYAVPPSI